MNLNTFQISQCIANKDYSTAELAITDFIEKNIHSNDTLSIPVKNNPMQTHHVSQEEVNYTFCGQFVTLITQLFSAPGYRPSKQTVNIFMTYKFVVDWLFSASLWNNTDALIDHLGLIQTDKLDNLKLNDKRMTLLLMLISLSSKYKLPWKTLFNVMPSKAMQAYVGLVTQSIPALSKENNAGFNYLLASAKDLPMLDLAKVQDLGRFNFPYFSCSYATSADKYEFKRWLTKLIRHNLPQWLSPSVKQSISEISSLQPKTKKKIGVMFELYSKDHAMFRCYNPAIIELAKNYELIAFTDKDEIEGIDLSIFSKAIAFDNIFDVNANAEKVIDEKLDIIFYPSIGMKFWGIYLSQLRLAPLQVMAGGHPASSYSPYIDNLLIVGQSFSGDDLQPYVSEKVIVLNNVKGNYIQHSLHSEIDNTFITENNHFLEGDEHIKIAINGVMTKVTYDIVEVCKRIEVKANKKVTFVFFSSYKADSLAYLATKKQLSKVLKSVEVSCYENYQAYMKVLSKCHFLLPTLPFGGSNSNVDAMTLNKPKFFLKGTSHLYTRTDQAEWDRVDLQDELGCDNADELVEKAVELVNDKNKRKILHQAIINKSCFEKTFFQSKANDAILSLLIDKSVEESLSPEKAS